MAERIELDLDSFRANYSRIETELAEIASKRGSPPARIVVVSKYLTPEDCARLRAEGFSPLGENRAQELGEKSEEHDCDHWHFIGHLQRNKISMVVPRCGLLHSLDSERLAKAIHGWVESGDRTFDVLVQVNVSREDSKGGLEVDDARSLVSDWVGRYPRLRFRGLMTMAPHRDPESCRSIFRRLAELRDEIRDSLPTGPSDLFCELSMGMTNDYRIAAEEGATWIRLGRVLYARPDADAASDDSRRPPPDH